MAKHKNLDDRAADLCRKFLAEGNIEAAELVASHALKAYPDSPQAVESMGVVLFNKQDYEGAVKYFRRGKSAVSMNNAALCMSELHDHAGAYRHLREAVRRYPNVDYINSNLGLQLRCLDRPAEAIPCYEKAIKLSEKGEYWHMLAGCYGEMNDVDGAERCLLKAVEVNPDLPGPRSDLANVYQSRGEWEKTWPALEWRFKVSSLFAFWLEKFPKRWDGSPVGTLLVHCEQGHGDCIQFFRYVRQLAGMRVVMHSYKPLERLFAPYVDEIFTDSDNPPPHDAAVSVISLPYHLKCPIPPAPYLDALPVSLKGGDLKVGITWAGSPDYPNDRRRSCHAKYFEPLSRIPGVRLFDLQYDKRIRKYRGGRVVDPLDGADFPMENGVREDFRGTAEIISGLDLVVAVDTSVLHLAGALGVPAFGLLPYQPDARWKISGSETDWYGSVRLFRQKSPGDWAGLFEEVVQAVTLLATDFLRRDAANAGADFSA